MKRIFSILLITAMLVALTPVMGTVALAEEYATVTSENGYGVRLREGPSKGYGVIRKYDVGTTVVVLQSGLEWSQIRVGETIGWMQNKYLNFGTIGSTGSADSSIVGVGTATVTSGNGLRVWLRTAPGGSRIQLYSPGTSVTIIEYGETWCYISINGSIGYMMTEFLDGAGGTAGGSEGGSSSSGSAVSGKIESVSINYSYPVVGDVLEAVVEPAGAAVEYSWKVDGVELGTESTFSVLSRYYGDVISLTVTGIGNCYGSATDTCEAAVQISKGLKSVKLNKTTPVVGDDITAILQPSSAIVEYYWRVGGVEVSNDAVYTVQESDIGKLIQLKVVGIGGYEGSVACSAEAYVVSDKELKSVELSTYYPVVDETVTAKVVPAGAQVKYTWTVDGEVVSNAASYKVTKLQLGKELRVTVEGIDPYTGIVSDITKRIASQELTSVSISGVNESPVVGDWLYASLKPSAGTGTFMWYDGEFDPDDLSKNRVGTGASLQVKTAMIDKQLMVRAEGTGIYSGEVFSSWTDPVIDNTRITSVTIDNTKPVVGDVITATPYPTPEDEAQLPAFRAAQSYVWMIDNEVVAGGYQYTVQESDIGKVIRVKVVGSNSYTGEAYSRYTDPVKASTKLTGAAIIIVETGENAATHAPEVGQHLRAVIYPEQAMNSGAVHYDWSLDGVGSTGVSDADMPVLPGYKNAKIVLEVTGDGVTYEGKIKVKSAKVSDDAPLNVTLTMAVPEAGKTPTYSASYKMGDKTYTGSVTWLEDNGSGRSAAEFDRHGTFLPNKTYVAAIDLKVPSDYTLTGATIKVDGITGVIEDDIVYITFGATGKQPITDFYIAEIPTPAVGETAITYFENDQYEAFVTWQASCLDGTVFKPAAEYEATIELTGINEFVTGGLPKDIFVVNNANSTTSTAGGAKGTIDPIIITAKFKSTDAYVSITADKTEVYLDGYNSRLVQCQAGLENFYGDPKAINYTWEIVDAVVDGTSINADGQLTIGMYETADRVIRVRVWADLDADGVRDEKEIALLPINLITGTDTDTAIKVEFTKAPVQLAKGTTGEFEVKVSNSTKGYLVYVFAPTSTDITATMTYTVPAATTEKQFVVKAISVEDPSVTASVVVKIDETESIIPKEAEEGEVEDLVVEDLVIEDVVIEEIDLDAVELTVEEETAEQPAETEEVAEEITAAEETTEETLVAKDAEETVEDVVDDVVADEIPEIELTEETPAEEPVADEAPEAEVTEEEPAAEPTIEIIATTEEEPAEEAETLNEVVIEIKDENGEVVAETEDETAEEPVAEEPAAEEKAEEPLTGVVIAIKDTVTGEVFEETHVEEPAAEEAAKEEKPAKKAETEKAAEEVTEEVAEEEVADPELDDLEGDKDVGESNAESLIKIRFVEKASEVKRGNTAKFSVETEGTEQGVRWSVRLSKNAEGKKVSTIDQDGVLTVSKNETSDKLVVVATSVEDNTVRARWIVTVTNPVAETVKKSESEVTAEDAVIEETENEVPVVEETVEQPKTEEVEEEVETERESEGLSDEQLEQILKELEQLAQENGVLDNF